MRTSFHHQPEAQHPKSSAIHKLPADYPIYWGCCARAASGPVTSNGRLEKQTSGERLGMSAKCHKPTSGLIRHLDRAAEHGRWHGRFRLSFRLHGWERCRLGRSAPRALRTMVK